MLIVDSLIPYACIDTDLHNISSAEYPLLPTPLLPNGNHTSAMTYFQNTAMIGMPRRIPSPKFKASWLERIVQGVGFSTQKVIKVPV